MYCSSLGTDFPYESFMPTSPKIVQVDVRAERLGRRSKLDLGLCGDVGDTIRALLPLLKAIAALAISRVLHLASTEQAGECENRLSQDGRNMRHFDNSRSRLCLESF